MPNVAAIGWFKRNFGKQIEAALVGTPFDLDMLVAIACQETGYIWSNLRNKPLSRAEILALCVGDTIDYKGPKKGRQAFPKTKADLIAEPDGQKMFDIARKALVDMAKYVPGYSAAVANPDKFCHGFGVFQRDLQFFLNDPHYFLDRKYEKFEHTLAECIAELKKGAIKLQLDKKDHISDEDFVRVAIVYNTGRYKPEKGLQQGHFDGKKYYGEWIYDYLKLSRKVSAPVAMAEAIGRFVVVARGGLWLRKGPGLDYDKARLLETGSELTVLAFDGPDGTWARVDLEDDGLVDGHVSAAFIAPAGTQVASFETVEEPDEVGTA